MGDPLSDQIVKRTSTPLQPGEIVAIYGMDKNGVRHDFITRMTFTPEIETLGIEVARPLEKV